jgi:6-pyruvoyl-tetrahydropterin synthase
MSWKVGIEFIGGVDPEGVVFDFSKAKKYAKKIIDDQADHKFICPRRYIDPIKTGDQDYYVITIDNPYKFIYSCPKEAVLGLDDVNVNSISSYLEGVILEGLKETKITNVKLTLKEEKEFVSGGSYYCYTHGLKLHCGPCSRLMHGHQSTIKVYLSGQRREDLERAVADHFYDKHLVLSSNVRTESARHDRDGIRDIDIFYISYNGGEYNMTLPISRCVLFPYETTVEFISKYIAEWIRSEYSLTEGRTIEVHAFEGIGKGSKYVLGPNEKSTLEKTKYLKG